MSHKPQNLFAIQVVPEINITRVQPTATEENNENQAKELKTYFKRFFELVGVFGQQTLSVNLEARGSIKSFFYALSAIMIVISLNAYRFMGPKPEFKYYLQFLSTDIITVVIFAALYTYMFHFDWILFTEENGTFPDGKPFQRFLVIFGAWYSAVIIIIMLYVNDFMEYPGGILDFLSYQASLPFMLLFIWFEQPLSKRLNKDFRKRLRWFLSYPYAWLLGFTLYQSLDKLATTIPRTYQPIMALVIPLAKYVFNKFLGMVAGKASRKENNSSTKFAVGLRVACQTGLWIVINIGKTFSLMTTLSLVLVDLVLNLRLVRRIWKLHRKTTPLAQNELKGTLQILSMREIMEFLPAMTYCSLLLMLYLGPNKENFKTSRGKTMEDLYEVIIKITYFVLFDIVRIGITEVILWKACKISLFSECSKLIERYWKVFGWLMALYIYWVDNFNFLNLKVNTLVGLKTWLYP